MIWMGEKYVEKNNTIGIMLNHTNHHDDWLQRSKESKQANSSRNCLN